MAQTHYNPSHRDRRFETGPSRKPVVDHYAASRVDVLACEASAVCDAPALILTFGPATIVVCNRHAVELGFQPRVMPIDVPSSAAIGQPAYSFGTARQHNLTSNR